MYRSQSARARLEGCERPEARLGRRKRRQSATGPIRKGIHSTNWTTKQWADSLRVSHPFTPENTLRGFGAEHPRNKPHPSEEFLRRQMMTTKRTQSLGETLHRHTKESFYEDYSTLYSNSGDASNEVRTQLVKLSFNPNNYQGAAARELAYNPPYPYRLMREQTTGSGSSETSEPAKQVACSQRGASPSVPISDTSSKKALSPSKSTLYEATEGDGPASDEELFKSTFTSQALPGVDAWMRMASRKEREAAVAALRKANTQRKPKDDDIAKGMLTKPQTVQAPSAEAVRVLTTEKSPVEVRHLTHHHHHLDHHSARACQRCSRRQIQKDYSAMSSSTRLGEEVIPAEMPGNPPPPRSVLYRRHQGAQYDPKTNAKTFFLASKPPHRSHFAIAPDWPSEHVDPQLQLTRKKRMR